MPDEPEVLGLLALMLLHDARREARVGPDGPARAARRPGPRRAGIGRGSTRARHCVDAGAGDAAARAVPAAGGDRGSARRGGTAGRRPTGREIVGLYDAAPASMAPSPVVELNRAVAVAMATGRPDAASPLVDALAADGELDGYHPYHATRADLLRRLGRHAEAAEAYGRARDLTTNEAERTFLEGRHAEMLRVLN